jgi:ankyrin repeat protein
VRRTNLAVAWLGVSLAGCAWVEEQRQLERRRQAETNFVEGVGSNPPATLRASLEQDRTLANAFRMVPGRRRSYKGESALTMAIKHRPREIAALLLEFGADPNLPQGDGESPLSVAMGLDKDRADKIAVLLEKGADPERIFPGGSALHRAASMHSAAAREAFPLLLAKARGVGGYDGNGWTPLHRAAASANPVVIRLLVAKGADVNVRTHAPRPGEGMSGEVAGTTPLAIVARDRQIDGAATFCALGADPDLQDSTGASARQVAARVAEEQGKRSNPIDVDLRRHVNMAAFLAKGGGCDALLERSRRGEKLEDAWVLRIANESECEAGLGWSCGQAGWAYHRGEGARENDERALELFQKGCEKALTKSMWSCGMVGIFHVEGTFVAKNPTEGALWLAKGCETPDPKRADEQACNRLGLLYATGSGVTKDLARARALFKRACDEKYERACANLSKYAGG